MRRFRKLGVGRAAEFLKKFPLKSFLLQAPQVTADLWGVGIQLGSVMGFVADTTWGLIRGAGRRGIQFRAPPPSDPLGKAYNYATQPAYQYTGGDWLSYEDHWLLLAADVVALGLIMQNHSPALLDERAETIVNSPLIYYQPWHPATLETLDSLGWDPEAPQTPPYPGMDDTATYGQVLEESANRFPVFLEAIQRDFPAAVSPAMFANSFSELVMDIHRWASNGNFTVKQIYEPEELILARCFEYSIFPPDYVTDEMFHHFIETALLNAAAVGKELPGIVEMREAAREVWGGYVTQ